MTFENFKQGETSTRWPKSHLHHVSPKQVQGETKLLVPLMCDSMLVCVEADAHQRKILSSVEPHLSLIYLYVCLHIFITHLI